MGVMRIIRDFSLEAVNELRGIIKKNVDEEDQFFLFDWFEDTFQKDDLDIKRYIDNVEEYHAHMVDKHIIDGEKFEGILKRVHAVDINYANRLSSISECMVAFNRKIMDIADMITPSVITLEGTEYEKLVTGARRNYGSAVLTMINNIEGLQKQMPELRDIPWYESALNAVGGFGVSLIRDSVEGLAFLPYAIVDGFFGTSLNKGLNSSLDELEEKIISPLVTDEKWYYRGKVAGDATCIVIGIAGIGKGLMTILSGITIGGSGVLANATGIGTIYGAPAIAVSVPIVLVGIAEVAGSAGIYNASRDNYAKNLEKLNSSRKLDLDELDLGKEAEQLKDGARGPNVIEVEVSRGKYPESAKHIEDAIASGKPDVLTIDRGGAKNNRKASLKGIDKVPGKDLDEYPPAMFKEGASVRPINPSDNRGSGSSTGHKLRPYPNGTKVKYKITKD